MSTPPTLTSEEIERYARHIVLPEIGGVGQQRLKAARVLVLGAGGLGTPVLQYLAAAGVGTLGIVDDDIVALSNLQRQVIHDSENVGKLKTESAENALQRINPNTIVERHDVRLFDQNAHDLVARYDVIVDGSDNADTRYALADACHAQHRPLVHGAIGRFDGFVTVLMPFSDNKDGKKNPSLRDLFPQAPKPDLVAPCAQTGVVGALTGVVGSLQAMEVLKLLTGIGEPLIGRLLIYDALAARFDTIRYGAAQK